MNAPELLLYFQEAAFAFHVEGELDSESFIQYLDEIVPHSHNISNVRVVRWTARCFWQGIRIKDVCDGFLERDLVVTCSLHQRGKELSRMLHPQLLERGRETSPRDLTEHVTVEGLGSLLR